VRYIDMDRLLADDRMEALIGAAEAASEMLDELPDPERKAFIEANEGAWKAFRDVFEEAFGRKCWYTESTNPGTDNDVDHFRPKGAVVEAPEHGGYWWLAFRWRNFRFSSHRANRPRRNRATGVTGGKAQHFPIVDEAARWRAPAELCRERPVLLDPTDPSDPALVAFDQDGTTVVAPAFSEDQEAIRRVTDSREILHLDWPAFLDGRRAVYREVFALVETGEELARRWQQGDESARDSLRPIAKRLIDLADELSEYSGAAAGYIRRYQDKDWIRRAVMPHVKVLS
jgi:hypothetical protein